MTIHQERTHPVFVAGCGPCRWGSAQLAPSAAPTRQTTEQKRQFEYQKNFAAEFTNGDREAYRRLRQNGVQPPTIAGSAALERGANTEFEIASGAVFPESQRKSYEKALDVAESVGFDPLKPSITPKSEVD